MTLTQGRLLRGAGAGHDAPTAVTRTHAGRRVPGAFVRAREEARQVVEAAARRAAEILQRAEGDARRVRAEARDAGRAEGLAEAAALALSLREREARADEAALDRTLALARLLAERLVTNALSLNENAVRELARGALAEASGARSVVLRAHPQDAAALSAAAGPFDPEGRVHSVVADAALGRGDFILETDVGTVHARLGAGLDHLAARLREALRP